MAESNITKAELEQQVAELQAKTAELEQQLASKPKDAETSRRELADSISDGFSRKMRETSSVVRGLTLATLEGFRLTANAASAFANEVLELNQSDSGQTAGELMRGLPSDIVRGASRAIDETMEIPSSTVDKFYESYREVRNSKA